MDSLLWVGVGWMVTGVGVESSLHAGTSSNMIARAMMVTLISFISAYIGKRFEDGIGVFRFAHADADHVLKLWGIEISDEYTAFFEVLLDLQRVSFEYSAKDKVGPRWNGIENSLSFQFVE